ncbi:hypothetical protein [Chromobacterium haemolyticum]|nr:hypothetical protein [Chromobacterium haemolyticum]
MRKRRISIAKLASKVFSIERANAAHAIPMASAARRRICYIRQHIFV